MRALVTGGSGFVGANICRSLLNSGQDVVCLDNFVTGRMVNIEALLSHPNFQLVTHDIVQPLPALPACDRIYHLASPASPPGYQRNAIATLRANAEGTRRLLDFAARSGSRFLLASTSEIYGDPLEHPQRESYRGNVSSIGPRSMYDEAKRYAEALTIAYVRGMQVDARIVRIFNTYGPHSDPQDGRMVPNFITQALENRPITVYGAGDHTRSLCFVSDLVDGLTRAMESANASGEVFNLGNPDEHTIDEFAILIRELSASRSEIVHVEGGVGDDPGRRRPDITLARDRLGWSPRVGLVEGLSRTIEYFRLAGAGVSPT